MSSSKDPSNTRPIKRKAFKDLLQKARISEQSEDIYNVGCCHNYGWGPPAITRRLQSSTGGQAAFPRRNSRIQSRSHPPSRQWNRTRHAHSHGLFKRAAEKGNAQAMHALSPVLLGNIYTEVPYNEVAGRGWLIKAAKAGHPSAMNNLGVAYAVGAHGLPACRIEALHWLNLAVEHGHDTAKYPLLEFLGDQPMQVGIDDPQDSFRRS